MSDRINERAEGQYAAALEIALAAKVVAYCEFHDDVLLEGPEELAAAYRLGNARMTRGQYKNVFATPRQMTDAVKSIFDDEVYAFGCTRCDNSLSD
jgi:hypothetical protein